jgi:DNA replication protein DnaC
MDEKSVRSIQTLVSPSGELAGPVTPQSAVESASVKQAEGAPRCMVCGDTGWKTVAFGNDKRVTPCECRLLKRSERLLSQALIPPRYKTCDFGSYAIEGSQRGAAAAKIAAAKFVEQYPLDRTGLLLIGPSGGGKTHLAIAILKELILKKGIPSLFCDYRDLLKQIQNSYNPSVEVTELELLRPVFETEVIVLDDLGAVVPTGWVWDTVSVILNTRYNENRTTIITTNFQDGPAAAVAGPRTNERQPTTLGDRIGERMRSRLCEMCRVVDIDAPDYRKKFRTAGFR